MSFEEIVKSIDDIKRCYEKGLRAFKGDESKKIRVTNPRLLNGSVGLDFCTVDKYPDDPRWDYIVGYKKKVFFIEIHPASTSNVKEVVKKSDWLRKWLKDKGSALKPIISGKEPYRWVATGKVAILRNSKYARELAQNKISFLQKITCLD